MQRFFRRLPLIVLAALIAGALYYGYQPQPIRVETELARQGTLQVAIHDDGRTRVREKYVISAPVAGKLLRIECEEGEPVRKGVTVLARIEPGDPGLLDARAEASAEARVRAAEATKLQASAAMERANEAVRLAAREFERGLDLRQKNAISDSEFEELEHKKRIAEADLRSAQFGVSIADFEIELAKAALIRSRGEVDTAQSQTLTLVSPVDGQVLRVLEENARVVAAGTPVLEIGDPRDLEMEIDVLSTDAVRIRPGSRVEVNHWGGEATLQGVVRLVEPSAFLKISALGVEEQRVNVIADFVSPYSERPTLGDNYRIEASIVVDEADNAIIAPLGALLRIQDGWIAYVVGENRAVERTVTVGRNNGIDAEIVDGIEEGDALIMHPSEKVLNGVQVRLD